MACDLGDAACWPPLSGSERPGLDTESLGVKAAKKPGCV